MLENYTFGTKIIKNLNHWTGTNYTETESAEKAKLASD